MTRPIGSDKNMVSRQTKVSPRLMGVIDKLHLDKFRFKAEAYREMLRAGTESKEQIDPFMEESTERLLMSVDPIIDAKIEYVMRTELPIAQRTYETAYRLVLLRGEAFLNGKN